MSKLTGKVAIVTGASKGIGAGIAKSLAAEGAAVVVNYASSKTDADRVVAEITAAGGKAVSVQGNVGKPADITRLFAESTAAFGPVDVLVNNAGVFQFGPLEEATEAEFHREFDINVLGTIFASQAAAKQFGPTGGSIINISSVVSTNPVPGSVIYAATKGAVDTITRGLATELGPRKIRVNSIAPGGVETEGTHTAGIIGSDFEKQMVSSTPLGRLGQPDDIARVAVFLASDDSQWVSGERITAAGGFR
jgi:3-oxoacyl-[acyl-carrier protein] reductase